MCRPSMFICGKGQKTAEGHTCTTKTARHLETHTCQISLQVKHKGRTELPKPVKSKSINAIGSRAGKL